MAHPTSNKRQLQKEATRRLLLDTAYALYSREGFAIPTSQVAKEAGVSHGALFAHFPTADHLITAMVEEAGLAIAGELHRSSDKQAGLEELLRLHVAALAGREPFYHRLITQLDRLPPGAVAVYHSIQSAVSLHLSAALEREAGGGRDLPAAFLFNAWVGLLHHYIAHRKLFVTEGSVLKRRGDELVDGFLTLLRSAPPNGRHPFHI